MTGLITFEVVYVIQPRLNQAVQHSVEDAFDIDLDTVCLESCELQFHEANYKMLSSLKRKVSRGNSLRAKQKFLGAEIRANFVSLSATLLCVHVF